MKLARAEDHHPATRLPVVLSDDQHRFIELLAAHPLYWEVRGWFPALTNPKADHYAAGDWLVERGHVRGTTESRNDWMAPRGNLFIFREEHIALEFKLAWG